MKVEMNEVNSLEELLQGHSGDYMFAQRSDGSKYPIIVCPKCLKPCSCSRHTLVQESPLTIRASFGPCNQYVKDKEVCKWHGWITDGIMEGE
jgi:hypothetical protein